MIGHENLNEYYISISVQAFQSVSVLVSMKTTIDELIMSRMLLNNKISINSYVKLYLPPSLLSLVCPAMHSSIIILYLLLSLIGEGIGEDKMSPKQAGIIEIVI